MPQEQQSQGGNFTPISGLVQHTAKPLEAFNQVGDALQQRYWQAKQQYNVLDQTIKNMPMFDKEVDQQYIDAANKKISDTINPIIENDDFHKAQGTVMDLTKEIGNDKGIKAINKNVALWSQVQKDFDERKDKQPDIRLAEARMTAYAKMKYREQGGALDKNGNYQQVPIWQPVTDMNLAKYKDKIRESFSKLEGIISHSSTTGEYNLDGMLSQLPGEEAKILRQYYTQHKSFKSVTKERIQKMAEGIIGNDEIYKATLKDVADVQLFNSTGKLVADESVMSQVLSNNSELTKRLSLQQSPGYAAAFKELSSWYTTQYNNSTTNAQIKQLQTTVERKKQLLEKTYLPEGSAVLTKLLNSDEKETARLYNNIAIENLNNSVLHSADAFAYSSQLTDDIDQINTGAITDRLLKKKDEVLSSLATNTITGNSTVSETDTNSLNPESDEGKAIASEKVAFEIFKSNLKPLPTNATQKQKDDRQFLLNSYQQKIDLLESANKTKEYNLNRVVDILTPSELKTITNSALDRHQILGFINGSQAAQALYKKKFEVSASGDTFQVTDNNKDVLVDFIKRLEKSEKMTLYPKKLKVITGDTSSDLKTQYLFLQAQPKELLESTPSELIRKYGKGLTFNTEDMELLHNKFDTYKYDMYNAISQHPKSKLVIPETLIGGGVKQDTFDQQGNMNVIAQLKLGNAIDADTGKKISAETFNNSTEDKGFHTFMDKDVNNLNVNDANGVIIYRVNNHTSSKGISKYRVQIPVEDSKGNIIRMDTKNIILPKGAIPGEDASTIHKINRDAQLLNANSSTEIGTSMTARDGIIQNVSLLANDIKDHNGAYIRDHETIIADRINKNIKTTYGIQMNALELGDKPNMIQINPTSGQYVNITLEMYDYSKKQYRTRTIEKVNVHNISTTIAAFKPEIDDIARTAIFETVSEKQ